MHESIGIFLDKIQAVVEMAYSKNSNFASLEKISNEILNEINKLILLKGELHSLSSIEIKDDRSFHACLILSCIQNIINYPVESGERLEFSPHPFPVQQALLQEYPQLHRCS